MKQIIMSEKKYQFWDKHLPMWLTKEPGAAININIDGVIQRGSFLVTAYSSIY